MTKFVEVKSGEVVYLHGGELKVVSSKTEYDKIAKQIEKENEREKYLTLTKFEITVKDTKYYVPLKMTERVMFLISQLENSKEREVYMDKYFEMVGSEI